MTSKGSLPGQLRFPSPFSVVVSFHVFHASVYLPEPRLRLSVSESLRSGPEFLMVMFCVSIVVFVFTFLEARAHTVTHKPGLRANQPLRPEPGRRYDRAPTSSTNMSPTLGAHGSLRNREPQD